MGVARYLPGGRRQDLAKIRVLTAAATKLDLTDKKEARRVRGLRQGWQSDAWGYRDAIGELRYGTNFLANCAARMRLYPAVYPIGGETDNPVSLTEAEGIPPRVAAVAMAGMTALGNGKLAISGLMHSLSTNRTIAGECFLLGQQNPMTGVPVWTIRSVDEIFVDSDRYKLREMPGVTGGNEGWEDLDPELTVVSRIWTPHPRFRLLADSPLRAIMDDCESLLILRRMIRATGRSRLAGRGMLLVPDELSIKQPTDDNADPEADPLMAMLADAMMQPIGDEGVASAVVPIVVRGPGEQLDKVRHLLFDSSFDEMSSKVREEMVGVIATGLDIPKEVILGLTDLNHWSAWQVDDNTFRHHVEPDVIGCCDALTGAYLRPFMEVAGVDPVWVERFVVWYDPTELVTHPDQTADALQLHDRLVISDEALRKVAGFPDEDMPSKSEIQVRLLEKMRTWPPNLVMAFLHAWDPTLVAPPITVAGTIPGIKPTGVDTGEPLPGALPPPGTPALPAPVAAPAPPKAAAPPADQPAPGPPPITASASPDRARLSRKLVAIDQDLRTRLQTAANAAMLRQLERAGAKLRPKVAKDETMRGKIAHRKNERVTALLGPALVAATGLSDTDLIGGDWSGLRAQFYEWTAAAQKQAIAIAIRIGSLAQDDDAVKAAETAMSAGRDSGWEVLSTALTNLGHHLLYSPDPNIGPGDWADLNPDTLVPTGTIRAALGIAGGGPPASLGLDAGTVPVGQVGTGSTITDLLTSAGVTTKGYSWVHGPSLTPFEGHENLDGVDFENFDDEALANPGSWPAVQFFLPGDHDGCSCDFMPIHGE